MNITFGTDLDGHLARTQTAFASAWVGPASLLDLAEKQLGIGGPIPSRAQRIIAAREVVGALGLGEGSGEAAFGAASFANDPTTTAEVLLRWRDDLVLAGWDGRPLGGISARIALLERLDAGLLPPFRCSEGDRLLRLLDAPETADLGWAEFWTVDPPECLPHLWQRLLQRLGAKVVDRRTPENSDSDLGRFQAALRGEPSPFVFEDDGSLRVITAYSEHTLARVAGRMIAASGDCCVVGGTSDWLIDHALAESDSPSVGLASGSRATPVSEMLPLALRLRWSPLDPRDLHAFLTHPVCPVTSSLRRRLVNALEHARGIGGPVWKAAIQKCETSTAERHPDDPDTREKSLARIASDLASWIEVERFDRAAGAPVSAIAETCATLADWASRRSATVAAESALAYLGLAAAARDLAGILPAEGTLSRLELERLSELVRIGGTPSRVAEVGHAAYVRTPGAAFEPTDDVFWWDATEQGAPVATHWTEHEMSGLEASGIRPLSPGRRIEHHALAWETPVRSARKRLTFYLPAQRGGEPIIRHPLLSRLKALLGDRPLPIEDADAWIAKGVIVPSVPFRNVAASPLRPPKHWWKLPDAAQLIARSAESFTSLSKFLYSPYQWTLRYLAKIEPGTLGAKAISFDSSLQGTLIHRLAEDLVQHEQPGKRGWQMSGKEEVEAWVDARWPTLLEQEGAILLLPGMRSENVSLKSIAVVALADLCRLFRQWGIVEVSASVKKGPLPMGHYELEGALDLVLVKSTGEVGILDLKFGGAQGKVMQVEKGRPLQLAVYAKLLGDAPPVAGAFYILTKRRLITRNPDFFTGSTAERARNGSDSLAECWREFEQLWRWRRDQLDAGWIEVLPKPVDPGEEEPPGAEWPLGHWDPKGEADKYDDYTSLAGFGEEA